MPRQRDFISAVILPLFILICALTPGLSTDPMKAPINTPVVNKPQNTVVLTVFSSKRCGGCQAIKTKVDQLEKSGIKVVRVDVDARPEVAKSNGITSLPTIIVEIGDKVYRSQDIDQVIRWLNGDEKP